MNVRIAAVPALLRQVSPADKADGDLRVVLKVDIDPHWTVFHTPPEFQAGCPRRQRHDKLTVCVEIRYGAFGLAQGAAGRRIRLAVAADDAHARRSRLPVEHAHGQLL